MFANAAVYHRGVGEAAVGVGTLTGTVFGNENERPKSSVTVSVTVKVASRSKTWEVWMPLCAGVPSPKSHEYDTIRRPWPGVDWLALKLTRSLGAGSVGENVNCGTAGPAAVTVTLEFVAAERPRRSEMVSDHEIAPGFVDTNASWYGRFRARRRRSPTNTT